jgi:flagellar biosynthesis/type III secretory pathway protein FliH
VNYITSVERIGIQKGMEKGIQKGMEKGMEEGIQKGEAAMVLRLIQRRFGNISKSYKRRIMQTDADALLLLGEKILEAKTLEDLFEQKEQ